jgi:hypothetical protein
MGRVGHTNCRLSKLDCALDAAWPATEPAPSAASAELHKWAPSIYKHACGL